MFFIIGSARSGTTMLRIMLNAHRDIAVPPESRFIVELWRGKEIVELDEVLDALERHRQFQAWELPIEKVLEELSPTSANLTTATASSKVRYAEAMEAPFRAYAKERGKTCWGDKTPRYVEQIPLLQGLFPNARFVHQVRDGRNVALSYADVPFGPKTVGAAAALWSKRVFAGIEQGRPLGSNRYMEPRYEELVAEPEAQIKQLCDFLQIEFDSGVLDYAERSKNEVLPRAARYNPNITKPPTEGLRSWETLMPDGQVEVFEAVAGAALDRLGYERRFQTPSLKARAIARLSCSGLPIARLRG